MIVRRRKADALYIGLRLHGDVAERVSEVYLHTGLLGKGRKLRVVKQGGDYLVGDRAVYGACRVREDALFLKGHVSLLIGDHVAAVCNVAGIELYARRRGLERSAACVVKLRIAAEDGHNRRVASGGQTVRNVQNAAYLAACGKLVNKGLFCIFKRSQTAELRDRVVGYTVTYYENVLHRYHSLLRNLEYESL